MATDRTLASPLVGRSMGGAVAQLVALERPDLVGSLVLCASFAKLDPMGVSVLTNMREVLEWRGNWADHARHSIQNFVGWDFFNREREAVARIEVLIGVETRLPTCYIRHNHACLEHDTLPRLGEIRCPTLAMGRRSRSDLLAHHHALAKRRHLRRAHGPVRGLQSLLPDRGCSPLQS